MSDGPPGASGSTQWLSREGPVRLRAHKIRVDVVGGPDAGRQVALPGPAVRVGSADGCDLVLHDPTVSRHHLTLRLEPERIRVIDNDSTNGTYVDGVGIRDAYARPNSTIVLGASQLRLAMLPDVVEIPLSTRDHFGALLGQSPAMRQVFAILERAAASDAPILCLGESGCGKELAARAVHDASPRRDGPFVVFDCGAASDSLKAPQFTATNGPWRPLIACTWRATSSLPVPVSPMISTVAPLRATRSIWRSRSCEPGS
jgi:hypothetical protein